MKKLEHNLTKFCDDKSLVDSEMVALVVTYGINSHVVSIRNLPLKYLQH